MPRVNRTEICATDEIQVFHLINRCVRRTFLCGEDVTTGKDYSHRKEWIRSRLEELAGIFALDVMSFAVLSNHLHVVVRTRPDKRSAISAACAPILDRMDCSQETWFDLVKSFRKRFRNEAGSLLSVRAFRSKRRERRAQAATA